MPTGLDILNLTKIVYINTGNTRKQQNQGQNLISDSEGKAKHRRLFLPLWIIYEVVETNSVGSQATSWAGLKLASV